MIPEERRDAVARALREVFDVEQADDIRNTTGGLSKARVFKIVVRERPYLLRVVVQNGGPAGPGTGDQTHHFACMKLAADAGVGPKVWYTNAEDGVSITDFVPSRFLPRSTALELLPAVLRKVHTLPAYPTARIVKYRELMDQMVRRFHAAGWLPASETADLLELYEGVSAAYSQNESDMVLCHNDLRPENILFDGERAWLVDWEAAFANDRYLDLAIVANFVINNDQEEEAYLREYFGEAAGAYRRARFYLMRQLLHVFCTAFLIQIGAKGKPVAPATGNPDFREYHDRIRAGEIDLGDDERKIEYARVHLNQALLNMRSERCREAITIVSAKS